MLGFVLTTVKFVCDNLQERQKKLLKIHILQTLVLFQIVPDISFVPDCFNGYPIKKVKFKGIWWKQDSVSLFMEM